MLTVKFTLIINLLSIPVSSSREVELENIKHSLQKLYGIGAAACMEMHGQPREYDDKWSIIKAQTI